MAKHKGAEHHGKAAEHHEHAVRHHRQLPNTTRLVTTKLPAIMLIWHTAPSLRHEHAEGATKHQTEQHDKH
jgi:hypothetical protein